MAPWVSIFRLSRWLCHDNVLFQFCSGTVCDAMFAVATGTNFHASSAGGTGQ